MKKFYDDLSAVKQRLVEMGKMGQKMIAQVLKALIDRDAAIIQDVLAEEKEMNRFHVEIDNEAIRLLAIYTPVAEDLRFLLMISRINSELERIGDQAVTRLEDLRDGPYPLDVFQRIAPYLELKSSIAFVPIVQNILSHRVGRLLRNGPVQDEFIAKTSTQQLTGRLPGCLAKDVPTSDVDSRFDVRMSF